MIKLDNAYGIAKNFLIPLIPADDKEEVLAHYLRIGNEQKTLQDLYKRLLESAQNANMKAKVIGDSINGVKNLGNVLFDFNPKKVLEKFHNNSESLLDEIISDLRPKGQIRATPRSLWPLYCKTILSAAIFFKQFSDGKDFYTWANHFYNDSRSVDALPLLISHRVFGIGYPLACDFLKELGFINYGKPDVHIIEIFVEAGWCKKGDSHEKIQEVIRDIAGRQKVTPYDVDKLFWLIGSGKFYAHETLGNKGKIGSKKTEFIRHLNAIRQNQ
jgi:hypothetical protein